ncbi:E3 ubiquitin-protein ligase TRAIP-like [Temnothorax curvispinosus]|uniref:E3 ubiquitin-protein ligase TRAIP-like n=1 Tax=Temnothorax curvispinosus TaxID=300111 RepID=A0A6J1QU88_9HYME|nr:E3 ubiquitin-protein ligase TRAIP-like [Temnothorax curvispinosus]
MNIVCVICSDLLAPSDDVFQTPCGHIFHFACLIQWLERSKTCPQCRGKTTTDNIRRIYFNFSNNDGARSLQNRTKDSENLHNLNAKIVEKVKKLKKLADEAKELRRLIQKVGNLIQSIHPELYNTYQTC